MKEMKERVGIADEKKCDDDLSVGSSKSTESVVIFILFS